MKPVWESFCAQTLTAKNCAIHRHRGADRNVCFWHKADIGLAKVA